MAKRRCQGKTKADKDCQAAPLRDSDYCSAHDPNRPDSIRFGSPEQAASAGGGRPRIPRVTEVMREWVEEHALELLQPYIDALGATLLDTVIVGEGQSMRFETSYPDHDMRMKAAEKLQDRAVGRPRQRVEHAGGEAQEPIAVDVRLDAKTREALAGALRGRPASRSQ